MSEEMLKSLTKEAAQKLVASIARASAPDHKGWGELKKARLPLWVNCVVVRQR